MKVIDNVGETLGDDLKAEIRPGSKLQIAAATFSIYAFEALRDELERVDSVEFLFTSPTFVPEEATDRLPKHRREFYIPQIPDSERSLYGSEFELRLRNQLTQKAIARECAEWIRRKARFKSNTTQRPMQSFGVLDGRVSYMPLQGFTSPDLGYERGHSVSNLVQKNDDVSAARQFLNSFEQIWHDAEQVADVTEMVREHIATVYQENSPERIYFLILYNIFNEFLDDITEEALPKDRTGYLDTGVWKALYSFQRDAATGIINKLETFNGCILADSVGLGKTFTALAVIKYYELRNMKVLVLTPKKLSENWTNYKGNVTTNQFVDDRFNYDVLAHTDLSRDKGESLGLRLDRVNWGNYDLVVIDESHNFRNADYAEDKESRYQRLMNRVIREGVQTKVLMLSATPVNNRFTDLKNQLQLAYEGESESFAEHLDISSSIEKIFRDAQSAFNEWSALDPEMRTTDRILRMLSFDFFELLDSVTIARSRKHIQAFYDTAEIGAFPARLAPGAKRPPLTERHDVPKFNDIFEQLQELNLGVYTPLAYVLASRVQKYEDLFNVDGDRARSNIGQQGREQGLKKLMSVNLLKRLESSVEAFRLTLEKVETVIVQRLTELDRFAKGETTVDVDLGDVDVDDDELGIETLALGQKVRLDLRDLDIESWRRDLWHDRETIRELLEEMRRVTPEHDSKLHQLKALIQEKQVRPINPDNRKVLIFSAFADTAEYLYRELADELHEAGLHSALITGSQATARTTVGTGYDVQEALTLFSPRSKNKSAVMPQDSAEIDVVIATDVISEGQNLQDCDYLINYDIHWNPVRIVQRFGRIDRIGSTNDRIQLVNFWPDISLDEYINLKGRVESRMVIADVAGTGDDNVLTQEDNDAVYRREQLRKLQDEVIELEEVRTGVSITDLGLNDFRMDLLAYVKENGDLQRAPKGLHAVVPADREKGLLPGVLYVLRNVDADSTITRGNRLHPYYLVYLDDEGNLISDHTQVKPLLDLIRAGCRGLDAPVQEVCRIFNAETAHGASMQKYSALLDAAIRSMIDVTEEQDLDSLFSGGSTTALRQSIQGLDDFELVAFLAVVDPARSSESH